MSCNFLIAVFLLGTIISALLTLYSLQRRRDLILLSFSYLTATICIWCFTSVGEVIAPDISGKYLWSVVQYFGSQTSPVFFFLFVLKYTRYDRFLSQKASVLFFLLPAFSILIAATNSYHHLLWPEIYLVSGLFSCVSGFYVHGPWYWVEILYSYFLLAGGMLLLLFTSLKQPPVYSIQTRFILFASVIPVAGNALYALFPRILLGFDPTPALFTITCVLIYYAITRLRLFDLMPVMCDEIIQSMGEGVVVLDQKDRIVRINPAASHILQLYEEHIGQEISSIYPDLNDLNTPLISVTSGINQEISMKNGNILSVNRYPVYDRYREITGTLLIIFDITDRITLENEVREHTKDLESISRQLLIANEKLHLLSSITRHDILNELTVLKGYLELMDPDAPKMSHPEYLGRAEMAAKQIEKYIQFTKYYDTIGTKQISWFNLHDLLLHVFEQYRDTPVVIENKIPETCLIFSEPLLESVFGNLIDNALRHGKSVTRISFSLDLNECEYLLICEDDGVGISEDEKPKIFRPGYGKNTGYGLFLIREILSISGITITEEGSFGKGAKFVIHVPENLIDLQNQKI